MIINQTAAGGLDINGVIEEYNVAAGASVSAGDFVQFFNGLATPGALTVLNYTDISGFYGTAVALDDSRVLITHRLTKNSLYAMIVTINGTTLTAGVSTMITGSSDWGNTPTSMALLNESTVLLYGARHHISTDSTTLFCCLLTIENNEVSMSNYTPFTVAGSQLSIYPGDIVMLNGKKAIATYVVGSAIRRARVITISGSTITLGSDVEMGSDSAVSPLVKLNESHALAGSGTLTILAVSGTTITVGTPTSAVKTGQGSLVATGNSRAFVLSRGSNNTLMGTSITTNGMELTADSVSTLRTDGHSVAHSLVLLSRSYILAQYASSDRTKIYAGLIRDDVTSSSIVEEVQIGTASTALNKISNNGVILGQKKAFFILGIYGSSSYRLYGAAIPYSFGVKPYINDINAVAKTGGSSGGTIEVYVPKS